jgi:hypothetical protein
MLQPQAWVNGTVRRLAGQINRFRRQPIVSMPDCATGISRLERERQPH